MFHRRFSASSFLHEFIIRSYVCKETQQRYITFQYIFLWHKSFVYSAFWLYFPVLRLYVFHLSNINVTRSKTVLPCTVICQRFPQSNALFDKLRYFCTENKILANKLNSNFRKILLLAVRVEKKGFIQLALSAFKKLAFGFDKSNIIMLKYFTFENMSYWNVTFLGNLK